MDIEIVKKKIGMFTREFKNDLIYEETCEAIVPDTYPDLGEIVSTGCTVSTRRREIENGRGVISGNIRCIVVYTSETGAGIYPIVTNIPFDKSTDLPEGCANGCFVTRCRALSCAASEVNPRKIAVRISLGISARVFCEKTLELASDIECDKSVRLNTLKKTEKMNVLKAVKCKSFTVTDDLEIPAGKPSYGEILRAEAQLNETDTKIIGNKAVIKGVALLQLLYRDIHNPDMLTTAAYEIPFSQIAETDADGDNGTCRCDFEVCGVELSPQNSPSGDGRMLKLMITAEVQIYIYERTEARFIADLYSNAYETETSQKNEICDSHIERMQKKIQMRDLFKTDEPVREIICARVEHGQTAVIPGAEGRSLSCPAEMNILYYSADGILRSSSKQIPASCAVDAPEEMEVEADSQMQGVSYMIGGEGEIEMRFNAVFTYDVCSRREINAIDTLTLGAEKTPSGERPSLTLRYAHPGESFWEIAKKHNTRTDDIFAANGMESAETAAEEKLLLIPGR